MKPVVGWTDALIYLLIIALICCVWRFRKTDEWVLIRAQVIEHPKYLIVLMVLMLYGLIGFLDTLHFKPKSDQYIIKSVLDVLLSPRSYQSEVTYSAPFATRSYSPEVEKNAAGVIKENFPRLQFAGQNLKNPEQDKYTDIAKRILAGILLGICLSGLTLGIFRFYKHKKQSLITYPIQKVFWISLSTLLCLICIIAFLIPEYHILGTDKVGRDVFYIALKSVRTGLVIGTITMLITLPFALLMGMSAGYFGGWLDDSIQFIYTLLNSVPGVLLIAAAMLSLQIFAESDPDLRLLILCIILGVTSWTTLCRLLRGETLKLRESDFVQSAIVLGTRNFKIIYRHIMPNLMHIVIISVVLDFSGLVLAEAVLSYVGVGVDPTSYSWGNMINASRLEMARDPVVWWSLCGALTLMFTLVLSANIFADVLQEALNPRMAE